MHLSAWVLNVLEIKKLPLVVKEKNSVAKCVLLVGGSSLPLTTWDVTILPGLPLSFLLTEQAGQRGRLGNKAVETLHGVFQWMTWQLGNSKPLFVVLKLHSFLNWLLSKLICVWQGDGYCNNRSSYLVCKVLFCAKLHCFMFHAHKITVLNFLAKIINGY